MIRGERDMAPSLSLLWSNAFYGGRGHSSDFYIMPYHHAWYEGERDMGLWLRLYVCCKPLHVTGEGVIAPTFIFALQPCMIRGGKGIWLRLCVCCTCCNPIYVIWERGHSSVFSYSLCYYVCYGGKGYGSVFIFVIIPFLKRWKSLELHISPRLTPFFSSLHWTLFLLPFPFPLSFISKKWRKMTRSAKKNEWK